MTAVIQQTEKRPSTIEPYFRELYQRVVEEMPKVDPKLLIRIMMFEVSLKKYPGPDIPHVHLDVYYKDGVNLRQKQEEGRDKYPIEITESRWGDRVIFSGLMGIRHVEKICSDPDILKVEGKATPNHN